MGQLAGPAPERSLTFNQAGGSADLQDFLSGPCSIASGWEGRSLAHYTGFQNGIFANGMWQVTGKPTVNAGGRLEYIWMCPACSHQSDRDDLASRTAVPPFLVDRAGRGVYIEIVEMNELQCTRNMAPIHMTQVLDNAKVTGQIPCTIIYKHFASSRFPGPFHAEPSKERAVPEAVFQENVEHAHSSNRNAQFALVHVIASEVKGKI